MPAAAPAPRPPPPPARLAPSGPARAAPGPRSLCDHSLKYLSSRITERKLQGSWLPAGRGTLEKPFLGPRGTIMPVFSPQHGLHPVHPDSSPLKPRVVTVVKLGPHPLRKITLLLNRRSVQTFEQLLADISEALGFPRWKNDRVRKLFNLKGREIRSVSDFFREGDAFIAMGKDPLTLKSMQLAMEALFPGKGRSLTLTQHSRVPSPRLRSRLYSRALKWGHHCGEAETLKSSSEAAGPTAAIRDEGKSPLGLASEERARLQKKWVRGKWEPEPGGKLPRESTLEERHASGEKHLGLEIEKTSGEIIRCEKCKRERELQQGLQRERLSLGTSELDLGKRHSYEVEKLVRTRSCRRTPEAASPPGGEEGRKEDGPRNSPRNPTQELRRPGKSAVKKEDRELEGPEGGAQAAAKAKKDLGEARPVREEGLREGRKEPRSTGRSRHGTWLLREQQAEAEKPPRPREEEQEAEKEKRPGASDGRKTAPRDEQPTKAEKEPQARPEESKAERLGRKLRPVGIIAANVEKHYDTGKVIGDGNFAVVKECRHRETRQAYAMKIIDKSKLRGKEDIVDSEILIIQSLSHPNIVQLHQVYETEQEIYLIMEYVQGGDLFDAIIENVKFPEREAALMFLDLCQALVHMHDRGIVHRDLKPENLLVQRNEDKSTTLKLADFGLAKHVVRPIFTVCGTPTYVAPEILSEKGYGLEVDLWAAGVILYILLCGFPPFRSPERDQDELFNIIQQGHFEFLAPYWDNISDAAKDLVSRLLVVDPKKRYTAHQVLQHPWIESARKSSMVRLPKEMPPGREDHFQSVHKRVAEQATL